MKHVPNTETDARNLKPSLISSGDMWAFYYLRAVKEYEESIVVQWDIVLQESKSFADLFSCICL